MEVFAQVLTVASSYTPVEHVGVQHVTIANLLCPELRFSLELVFSGCA